MSAIRRLGVGAPHSRAFDGQKDGHRDNYVLVVDEGIARYMEGLGQQVGDRDECALDWVVADVVTVIGASVCGGVLSACERSAVILDRAERDAMLESVGLRLSQ